MATGEYASSAWAQIIASAAISPLGVSALVILVVGFVILALIRRNDAGAMRLGAIVLLLICCGGLVLVASYNVKPTIVPPEPSVILAQPPVVAQSPPPAPSTPPAAVTAPASPPPARIDCGTAWSGWIEVGGAVGNPCPSGCSRGEELGQSYRAVGFPPRPQTQHKFQCWR